MSNAIVGFLVVKVGGTLESPVNQDAKLMYKAVMCLKKSTNFKLALNRKYE
jgi:hypothetical protein